jgi:translation initiation factor IF-1
MKHVRRIAHLKDRVADIIKQIKCNNTRISQGDRVVFFQNWNRDLEFELDAFKMTLKYYENDI